MARRKRRGQIARPIRKLCSRTLLEPVNKPQFKEGLRKIIDEWGPAFFYHIDLAIQAWINDNKGRIPIKETEIWCLVDEVEPRIRQEFEKSAD